MKSLQALKKDCKDYQAMADFPEQRFERDDKMEVIDRMIASEGEVGSVGADIKALVKNQGETQG